MLSRGTVDCGRIFILQAFGDKCFSSMKLVYVQQILGSKYCSVVLQIQLQIAPFINSANLASLTVNIGARYDPITHP